jgi:hypothetical protein
LLLRTLRLAPEFGIGIFDEALQFIALLHLQIAFPQALVLPLDLQGTFSEICRYSFEVSCVAFEAELDRLITMRWYATAAIVSAKPIRTTTSNIK